MASQPSSLQNWSKGGTSSPPPPMSSLPPPTVSEKIEKTYFRSAWKMGQAEKGIAANRYGTYEGGLLRGFPNGRGKMLYNDGTTFTGNFCLGLPNGQGKMVYNDGTTFTGNFFLGKPNGKGIMTWQIKDRVESIEGEFKHDGVSIDGASYKGMLFRENQFSNWRPYGPGEISYIQGDDRRSYQGRFLNGKEGEWGEIYFADGREYIGHSEEGRPCGFGKMTFPDECVYEETAYKEGTIYEGDFVLGRPHGRGKMTWTTYEGRIESVEGEFQYGELSINEKSYKGLLFRKEESDDWRPYGLGVILYSDENDKRCFQGRFVQGWPEIGTMSYADGSFYKGELLYEKPNGKGVLRFSDGSLYEGEFVNGEPQGKGAIAFPDHTSYVGEFVDGRQHGQGTLFFSDKSVYRGEFWNGMPSGQGTLLFPDGHHYEGEFLGGDPHGKGKMTFSDQRSYKGEFFFGKLQGKGVMTYPNGDFDKGDFSEGKITKGLKKTDSAIFQGDFEEGELTGANSVIWYRNWNVYMGEAEKGKPQGKGKFMYLFEKEGDSLPNEIYLDQGEYENGENKSGSQINTWVWNLDLMSDFKKDASGRIVKFPSRFTEGEGLVRAYIGGIIDEEGQASHATEWMKVGKDAWWQRDWEFVSHSPENRGRGPTPLLPADLDFPTPPWLGQWYTTTPQ